MVDGAVVAPPTKPDFANDLEERPYNSHESGYGPEELDAVVMVTTNKFHQPTTVDAFQRRTPPKRNTITQALDVQRVIDAI